MSKFASLMRRADTLRRVESDPVKSDWWVGYMRGLRRAHHGESFGTASEHQMWLSLGEITDEMNSKQAVLTASRAALGLGYRAGLTLEPRNPPEQNHENN